MVPKLVTCSKFVLNQGKEIFKKGLLQLPPELFKKFYIAKLASKDCILSRIAMTLREVDALEKTKDVLLEINKYDGDQLAGADSDLLLFKEAAQAHSSDVANEVAFHHAVYADELAALAITDMQLDHMTSTQSDDSDVSDDLVYEDEDDKGFHGSSVDEDQAKQ